MAIVILQLLHPWCDNIHSYRITAVARGTSRFVEEATTCSFHEMSLNQKTILGTYEESRQKMKYMQKKCSPGPKTNSRKEVVLRIAEFPACLSTQIPLLEMEVMGMRLRTTWCSTAPCLTRCVWRPLGGVGI